MGIFGKKRVELEPVSMQRVREILAQDGHEINEIDDGRLLIVINGLPLVVEEENLSVNLTSLKKAEVSFDEALDWVNAFNSEEKWPLISIGSVSGEPAFLAKYVLLKDIGWNDAQLASDVRNGVAVIVKTFS